MSLRNGRPTWWVSEPSLIINQVNKLLPNGSWGTYYICRGEGKTYYVYAGYSVVAGPFQGLAPAIHYADKLQ